MPQNKVAPMLAMMDWLVLSSLYECGGAVVLEAMAIRLPVIATRWGGPTDYLDETCSILIDPSSREDLIAGFAQAMHRPGADPQPRERMGATGARKITEHFDWSVKADVVLNLYQQILNQH
jgi:glycosyltransferase involved in cell wall biosynthesis